MRFERLAAADIRIQPRILDSREVEEHPLDQSTGRIAQPYPLDLANIDFEALRRSVGWTIASTYRASTSKSTDNSQKRLRICIGRPVTPVHLMTAAHRPPLTGIDADHLPGRTGTAHEYLYAARSGQGVFRSKLLKRYDATCLITCIESEELPEASLTEPWRTCSGFERLDPDNGILLSALVDRLFDKGSIAFRSDGSVLTSPALSTRDRE